MQPSINLSLQQTQKLIITPELRQAIVILQLSSLELDNYIQHELQENPLLEVRDDGEVAAAGTQEDNEVYDIDWQEYFADGSDLGYIMASAREVPREWNQDNYLTGQTTLRDHLMLQLKVAATNQRELNIGSYLIGNLDNNGYLRISIKEAASHLKESQDTVWRVLQLIQQFDPPGVGARNLVECLLLQMKQRAGAPPGTEKIIRSYLKDVAEGRMSYIARSLALDLVDVQAAVDYIRSLDPKPGRSFASGPDNSYIVPDIVIERVEGEYVVLVNDTSMPRLGINPTYQMLMRQGGFCDKDTRRFIENKLNAAAWLIRSVEQRRLTIYRVACCLAKKQREFLDKGIRYLKPLNMRQVAEELGIHESTVSRAVANKYVQTPQGVYELKFFFANGFENRNRAMTAEYIKRIIATAIEEEDATCPLTDKQIKEILKAQDIHISRRTVAKYRDELGIPAARKRKRY